MRVGVQRYTSVALPQDGDLTPILHEVGCAPGTVGTLTENLAATGIRYLDRPVRSE